VLHLRKDPQSDPHNTLHSERGARHGENSGRSPNPVIKVADLAWLEFEKPDLTRAEVFARAFGFQTALRTSGELNVRGTDAGAPCVLVRRGERTRFGGLALRAVDEVDVLRLADKTGVPARRLPEAIGGLAVNLVDPSGTRYVPAPIRHSMCSRLLARKFTDKNSDAVHQSNPHDDPTRHAQRPPNRGSVSRPDTARQAAPSPAQRVVPGR
jgi:hypothetical protein